MENLAAIIEATLDAHRNTHSNRELAKLLANDLTAASLQQLATLLGGFVKYDAIGGVILYTGVTSSEVPKDYTLPLHEFLG
jgi:hypothetical protein